MLWKDPLSWSNVPLNWKQTCNQRPLKNPFLFTYLQTTGKWHLFNITLNKYLWNSSVVTYEPGSTLKRGNMVKYIKQPMSRMILYCIFFKLLAIYSGLCQRNLVFQSVWWFYLWFLYWECWGDVFGSKLLLLSITEC